MAMTSVPRARGTASSSDQAPPPDQATATDPATVMREFIHSDYARVVAAVGLITRDRDHAEDAVQDALVKVLNDGHHPDRLAAWVTTVAVNQVRTVHRRRAAEQRAVARSAPLEQVADAPSTVPVDVADAVAGLPEKQQVIATMFYFLDQPIAQIASSLGVTEGTVKTHLHRARTALAAALGQEES